MNSITVAGQLGKDAEIRNMPDGTAVATFSVADNQGKGKTTIWWRCNLFGTRVDPISPYLTKGQSVTVSGSVTEKEYTAKDGQVKKSVDIRVNDIALQGGKRDAEEVAQKPAYKAPAKQAAANFDDIAF